METEVASFYLKASIPTLYNRLYSATANRPLLAQKSEEELLEAISKNLFDKPIITTKLPIK